MTISAAKEQRLREIAEREGLDPDEFVAAARDVDANGEDADERDENEPQDEREQGQNEDKEDAKESKKGGEKPDAAAESAVKAHGGRGYSSYEYPFLTVNEVREALFLGPIDDGHLYTGEWLAQHAGTKQPTSEEE